MAKRFYTFNYDENAAKCSASTYIFKKIQYVKEDWKSTDTPNIETEVLFTPLVQISEKFITRNSEKKRRIEVVEGVLTIKVHT